MQEQSAIQAEMAPQATAINQTMNQTIDQTLLDQTIDNEADGVRQSTAMKQQMEFPQPQIVEEKETSSKIYSRNRARLGGDKPTNDNSDFKFAPEVGQNDLTEKEQMSRAYKEMSAA